MYLSPRDEEILYDIKFETHVTNLAAIYTAYVELTPNNKKPISQREFYGKYIDNWRAFAAIENEGFSEN